MSRRSDSGLDGILLIDKPAGWTSHDVVARARRVTGQRRIGHTGTLDPMATGLLVLCLGQATRLVEFLTGHDKRYTGLIALGRTTSTDDAEGETVAEAPVPPLDDAALEPHLAKFRGRILQRPPAYSALKVQGRRAYDLARKGAAPQLPLREVTLYALDGRLTAPQTVAIDVACSAGTYIRSLARDLGASLGCGGHLASLRREAAGPFGVREAVTLARLEELSGEGRLAEALLPADEGVLEIDAAILAGRGTAAVTHGLPWAAAEPFAPRERVRIYSGDGEFVGVGSVAHSGEIRASKVFVGPKSAK